MFLNLILGIVAGALTPMAVPHVKKALASVAPADIPVGKTGYDLLTLILLLMVAAAIVTMFGGNSVAFLLLFGALIGLFGKQVWAIIMSRRTAGAPATGRRYGADDGGGPA
jgi:hypothetical protein